MSARREMLSCEKARRVLWPLDRPRELVAEEEAARIHLDECRDCRAFFVREAELSGLIERHGGGTRAPVELRQRIMTAIAREQTGMTRSSSSAQPVSRPTRERRESRGSGRFTWLNGPAGIIAAGLLLIVMPLTLLIARDGARPAEDIFVQDYLRRAVEENMLESPDAAAVSKFFMSELGVAVSPTELKTAEMSRAMVCLLRGQRAAMVEYKLGEHTVAHYILPRDGPAIGLGALVTESQRGVQVAAWSDAEFEHALVSDLPERELAQLASTEFKQR